MSFPPGYIKVRKKGKKREEARGRVGKREKEKKGEADVKRERDATKRNERKRKVETRKKELGAMLILLMFGSQQVLLLLFCAVLFWPFIYMYNARYLRRTHAHSPSSLLLLLLASFYSLTFHTHIHKYTHTPNV